MKAFFKNPKISGGFSFNPEARQRAKDHLLSVGYRPEQLKPIEWPEDAVYATRSPRGDWEFTYKSDILAERRKRMQRCLYWKREHDAVYTVPAYVWVFHIPGSNFYPGWWTYLIGKNIAEKANLSSLGFREQRSLERISGSIGIVLSTKYTENCLLYASLSNFVPGVT